MNQYTHTTRIGRWTVQDCGAVAVQTPASGTVVLSAEQLTVLELRAAIEVLVSVEQVGGPELKFARKVLALTRLQLARFLGVSAATVLCWENETEPFQRPVQLAVLHLLEELSRTGGLVKPPRSLRAKQ